MKPNSKFKNQKLIDITSDKSATYNKLMKQIKKSIKILALSSLVWVIRGVWDKG